MQDWTEIAAQISTSSGRLFNAEKVNVIGGGCINQAYCIANQEERYFVKLNQAASLPMFEAEAAGLQEISQSAALRVPIPLCWGKNDRVAWLVLEFIELGHTARSSAAELGAGLAAMHRVYAEQFGWVRNNTIGNTPQINTQKSDWVDFWHKLRLGYQLDLAKANGYNGKLQSLGAQTLSDLHLFFDNISPQPSLLHGDLWGGNYSYDDTGKPVLFDPAVYYGDRETDFAMTELFGGFSNDFYSAYRHEYPIDSGYNVRKEIYNLYHVLNHLNLFGGGYRNQAEQMMNRLLTEIR